MAARLSQGRWVVWLGLVVGGCGGPRPNVTPPPQARPTSGPTTAAATQASRFMIDLPRITDPADLKNRWFEVAVMHSSTPRLPGDRFDGRLRLGWDDRGVLLRADVTESAIHESDDDLALGSGTSIEIFEADSKGKEFYRATIAPGVEGRHPTPRFQYVDDRSKPRRGVTLAIPTAAKKSDQGYTFEALLPWDVLGIAAKPGVDFGLTVRINHPDSTGGAYLEWSPELPVMGVKLKPHVRLAEAAATPVTFAVDSGYERLHRARIGIAAPADNAGKTAVVRIGNAVVGQSVMKIDGRLATAEVVLPMPPIGSPYKSMTVDLDKTAMGTVSLRNGDDVRGDVIGDLRVVAQPAVFTQSVLPGIDFESPIVAEDCIGHYTIKATYYDADYHVVTSADKPGRYGAIAVVTPEKGRPFKKFLTLFRDKDFVLRPVRLKAGLNLDGRFGIDPAVAREQANAGGEFVVEAMRASRSHDQNLAAYLAGLSEIAPGVGDLPDRLAPGARDDIWWYGLKKKTGDMVPYKYLVGTPDLKKSPDKKFPLMLFLHGSGQRGNRLEAVKDNGPPKVLKNEPNWPFKEKFIVVSPQCPANGYWNPLMLRDLLDEVMTKYPVDPDRVYLTGLSLGGFGTWELAEWYPERFAALVPVCGGGDPADVGRIKDIPTWVFHGDADPSVRIENGYEMVRAMRDVHARIRFTVYPGRGHNCWELAYDDPKLYEWLLAQKRGDPHQPRATTPDTRPAEQ